MKQKQLLMLRTICVGLLTCFVLSVSFGQVRISGQVTDAEDKSGLIGVSIVVQGTTIGTTTDFDGNYVLEVPDENAIIDFSYTGYDQQSVAVKGKTTIDISMTSGNTVLDEVVVVGYTTRKKGELTGSVSTLDAADIQRTTNKDVAKSLAGKVPGLIVSDRGGVPGSDEDITLLIRGKSTLGNNAPLVLIDGVQTESFSHLTPQDIESLSVLKDGAAAIYGARAANGVILITTKRGKKGKPVINLSSTYSMSSLTANPTLMNSEQFAIYRNEAAERNGLALPFSSDDIAKYAAGTDPNFPSTDWFDETIADFSPEWRNTLTISGGGDRVSYYVSGDHIDQQGLYKSGDLSFKQYQLRSNIDIKVHDRVNLGVDVSGRFGDRNQPGVNQDFIYKHIFTNEPTEVGIYENGLIARGGENGANPIIMSSSAGGFVNRIDNNLRSRLALDVDLGFLTEGLSIQSFAGIRKWTTDTKSWYTPWTVYTFQEGTNEYVPQLGFAQQGAVNTLEESFYKFNEIMLNGTIRYDRSFGVHSFRAFAGTERFRSNDRTFAALRRDFPSNERPELFAGSDEGQQSSGGSREWARLNYFAALSYDFQKKYFLDLTIRRDGSSNFGPGNRFGTFPGVAAAWSIGNENFMKGNKIFDALKLRASWALLGNDQIGPFQFLTRYNYSGGETIRPNSYIFGQNGIRQNGYASANVPNPDITWEKADMKNIGLNFAMLNYRLTADFNYFYQKRTDILIQRNASIPIVAGITLPEENLGKVDNFGYEIQLGWNDAIGEVNYNLGFNFTQARNEVVFLDEAKDVNENLRREGFPLDSYIVFPTDGIFENQGQVDATTAKKEGTTVGEPIYLDTNGDGVIDAGDRIRVYSSNVPEIQYGFLGGVSYKNFDVNFLFQGQAKAEMLVFFDQTGALPEYVFNERWTPENTGGRYPRAFVQDDPVSGNQGGDADRFEGADFWLHDASFLRLKELEVGYSFTKEQVKFGSARIFFRGLNLLTMFSEVYDLGLDPEAAGYNNFRNSTLSSLKSYSFGVNLTF